MTRVLTTAAVLIMSLRVSSAADEQSHFFEQKVRPLLVARCGDYLRQLEEDELAPTHAADQTADLHTPRIGVRQENLAPLYSGMWTFVWVKGPEHKYCVLDLLCYEHSGMTYLDHKTLDGGVIELRHRSNKSSHVLLITTVTPEPGAIELVARPALAQPDSDVTLPDTLPRPNLCFRVKRSQQFFGSFPHPFPDFIRRCFIFTEKGMTFLADTERKRLPRIEDQPDDPRNQPPWVQVYTPLWRPVARQKSKETWYNYSPDRYALPVMGVVSQDGKHLTAIANGSATTLTQAWQECLHNFPGWLPADAPPKDRRMRVKIYIMPNDPDRLIRRVLKDFPNAKENWEKFGPSGSMSQLEAP